LFVFAGLDRQTILSVCRRSLAEAEFRIGLRISEFSVGDGTLEGAATLST
jgi:hypothetical protein